MGNVDLLLFEVYQSRLMAPWDSHISAQTEETSILILGGISSWHTMGNYTLWGHCGDSDGVAIRPCLDHLAAPGNGESEQIRLQKAPAR